MKQSNPYLAYSLLWALAFAHGCGRDCQRSEDRDFVAQHCPELVLPDAGVRLP